MAKTIHAQCAAAKEASRGLVSLESKEKNQALLAMADAILAQREFLVSENKKDLDAGAQNGLSTALMDRLTLTPSRLEGMAESLRTIAALGDPIGEILESWTVENGLEISKIRVPFGVIAIIYEARPNVTADAIGLAIKAGSSVVLRGSKSAYYSNLAISSVMRDAAVSSGIDGDCIQLLEDLSHEGVSRLVQLNESVDLVIPRGGAGLIQRVVTTATVPAIETGVGNCHVYVDNAADLDKAVAIAVNAKTQRPSVCNACESILVHDDIAEDFLRELLPGLAEKGVDIRGCDKTVAVAKTLGIDAVLASDADWDTEYLDLIVAIRVVADLDEAMSHIRAHGSLHSEAIISEDAEAISRFETEVDAAAILVNASTRFTDGGEFGFGAEMGISTQKMHARGPMGLRELCSYKYIVRGEGQLR